MKVVIDFDDPDPLPLRNLLRLLMIARIRYEVAKDQNKKAAARRLGVSRHTVQRALGPSSRRLAEPGVVR